jgi:hypothetical protein
MEIGAMMRVLLTVGLLAALLASWGCRPDDHNAGGEGSAADLWFRYHFIGTQSIARDEQGTQLKRVAELEQTVALLQHVLDRLARSPGVFAGDALTSEQVDQGATVLRPMFEDLLAHESFLEVRGPASRPSQWLLGVALPTARAAAWRDGLSRLREVWNLGEPDPEQGTGDTRRGGIQRDGAPAVVRWAEEHGWLLIGIGDEQTALFDRALKGLQEKRPPVVPRTEDWLAAEVDLGRVAGPLGLPPAKIWPRTELNVTGRDENLRTTMRVLFPEPVTGPLRAWQVPTNIVCEPLVSFTAMRGVAPWLERSDAVRSIELEPVPDELYFWAQAHTAFTTFGAFPTPDPTNRIKRIAALAPGIVGEDWQRQGLSQIEWDPANHQAIWKGLLIITPHLRPVPDVGTNFVVGGLFPQLRTARPPPADLLAQFVPRPDVLYYDWEITQARLGHWRHLAQLFAIIAGQPQFSKDMPGLNWLMQMETEPFLGNTITEITAVSPNEWLLTRRSHIGFNGLELVALARWVESRDFPRPSLRLPDDGTGRRGPQTVPPPP